MLSTVPSRLFQRPRLLGNSIHLDEQHYLKRLRQGRHDVQVLALCQRCNDYIEFETSQPAGRNSVKEFFEDAAPGLSHADCDKLGLFALDHRLIGLLDIGRGYPNKRDWFIGLLMIEPARRGQHLGHKILSWIKSDAKRHGVSRLFVLVYEQNRDGLNFWTREGFVEVRRNNLRRTGSNQHVGIQMMCAIDTVC